MRTMMITVFLLAAPKLALACPVCFGQNDSPMASAANLSVVFMLAVTVCVLAAFASFFIYLIRRARMVGNIESPPTGQTADASRYGSEGTAQC